MKWTVLTLFPGAFQAGALRESVIGRAVSAGILSVDAVNIRDFADPPHRVCDDTPYGGGPGMVMKPDPIVRAFRESGAREAEIVIALSASGVPFTDIMAREFAALRHVCLLCGHYEGVDQRAIEILGAREVAVGDFLSTGGEIPAMAVIDASSRYVPGVLGAEGSCAEESFTLPAGILEYPHYTRPVELEGREVPGVLRGGDHGAIRRWRLREALRRTIERRPDLADEKKILQSELAELYRELKKEGGHHDG